MRARKEILEMKPSYSSGTAVSYSDMVIYVGKLVNVLPIFYYLCFVSVLRLLGK